MSNPNSKTKKNIRASISLDPDICGSCGFNHASDPDKPETVQRQMGRIIKYCVFYYKFLPSSVKNYYDLDDMINEVVLHVYTQSYKFKRELAQESTFVCHTVINKCKTLLEKYSRNKRFGDTTEITEIVINGNHTKFSNRENEYIKHSFDAVERVIEYGSDGVLELLSSILNSSIFLVRIDRGIPVMRCGRYRVPVTLVSELRHLAETHAATLDDFVRVMRYMHYSRAQ